MGMEIRLIMVQCITINYLAVTINEDHVGDEWREKSRRVPQRLDHNLNH